MPSNKSDDIKAQGIPLAVSLTDANDHDVTKHLPLVDAMLALRDERGRPCSRPARVKGDRACHSKKHAANLGGVAASLSSSRAAPGTAMFLGATRWLVERTTGWPRQSRRHGVRDERRTEILEFPGFGGHRPHGLPGADDGSIRIDGGAVAEASSPHSL